MLFASTRLTLVRELGREHFRETIYATTRDELTPEGFEKHDKHEQLEAPLTEEERSLEGVKQAEAVEGARGTGSREIHLGQRMAMPVMEDALEALKELKPDGGRSLVTLVRGDAHLLYSKSGTCANQSCSSRYRKSTQKPKRSSSSLTRPPRPQYPSSRPASRLLSRASPSSATTTSTPGTRARRCSSSTRAPSRPAAGPSRTACYTR